MRCSPIKVLQILLIGSICAGIFVRLRDDGEASGVSIQAAKFAAGFTAKLLERPTPLPRFLDL